MNPQLKEKPSTAARGRQASIAGMGLMPPASARTLGAMVRHWRFVALVVTACVAATAGYVYVVPPKWDASARILVAPVTTEADMPGLGLVSESVEPARSLQTAVALLDTPTAAAATATALGAPWDPASVDRGVSLEPLGQSYVVEVKAQADSPSAAARLATAFMENALATRNSEIKKRAADLLALRNKLPAGKPNQATRARLELMARTGDPSLSMAQPASLPTSPAGLPAQYKIALSAFLGLCLAVAGVWARTRMTRFDDGTQKPGHRLDIHGWDR
ncbi:Wzz/FepE/Etk N-terminal domain-containing protein [Actinoplanes sp. NPDC004185]